MPQWMSKKKQATARARNKARRSMECTPSCAGVAADREGLTDNLCGAPSVQSRVTQCHRLGTVCCLSGTAGDAPRTEHGSDPSWADSRWTNHKICSCASADLGVPCTFLRISLRCNEPVLLPSGSHGLTTLHTSRCASDGVVHVRYTNTIIRSVCVCMA
jgi:hypothetical protein